MPTITTSHRPCISGKLRFLTRVFKPYCCVPTYAIQLFNSVIENEASMWVAVLATVDVIEMVMT